MKPIDDNDASRLVFDYLDAKRAFEIDAVRLTRHSSHNLLESLKIIQRRYDDLLATYCTPRIVALRLRTAYGDPPGVDPAKTRISSIRTSGDTCVVTTIEDTVPPPLQPETYEYHLVWIDGHPRIDNRRTRDLDGSWIDDVV